MSKRKNDICKIFDIWIVLCLFSGMAFTVISLACSVSLSTKTFILISLIEGTVCTLLFYLSSLLSGMRKCIGKFIFKNSEMPVYHNYNQRDYMHIIDESGKKVCSLLTRRLDELYEYKEAINDRYPYEDLFLQWESIDSEKRIIMDLLETIDSSVESIKNNYLNDDRNQ